MIEASPSRCTPEQWTAEQAARAMGVVDETDGEALGVEGAASGEIGEVGHEQPNVRGGMRWVAGGTALAVVAAAAWWSGAGNRDSREIPVHAAADVALIAGERTPNSGPGDFNSSNGSSHMKIQTTAAAALLGAAASAFQAQAGDAVQWRVADGGNGHWYQRTEANCWSEADSAARAQGCHLASVLTEGEAQFCTQFVLSESDGITVAIGGFRTSTSDLYLGWRWTTDEAFIPGSLTWMSGNPGCCGSDEYFLGINRVGHIGDLRDCPGLVGAILEWSADCNSDGIVDYGQCHDGTLPDYNGNNIPDCCDQGVQCTVGKYPVRWRVEDGGNGHWYRFVPNPATWAIARAQVAAAGGYLVTVNSPPEGDFLRTLGVGTAWIGLLQNPASPTFSEPTGGWEWISGEALDYTNWRVNTNGQPNEPNNIDGTPMDVAVMDAPARTTWNDVPQAGTYSYWIEWSADCNNDNIVDYGQILNGTLPDTNTNNIPDCCEPGNNCCVGDIYENHIVDGGDLGVLLSEWGVVTPTTNSDLNRDGFVNGADLGMLLANWGPCGG